MVGKQTFGCFINIEVIFNKCVTGVILATGSFSKAILGFGVAPLAAAAMVHTGAIVIDQLPQGNYFHVTANAMHMDIKERSHGILYEALVGGSAMLTATIL